MLVGVLLVLAVPASAWRNVAPLPPPASSAPTAAYADRLAERIDAVLARPALRGSTWGVEVRDAASGQLVYRRNGRLPMAPASALKLVGAAAAAHHLPPDYRFRTTLYADGEVRDGTLHGDLVLFGRGDPTISARHFGSRTEVLEGLADSLLARGIVRLTGGVVADESWWDAEHLRPDWKPHQLTWWYAAPVSALGFNDNSVDLRVEPGASVGAPARITPMPRSGFYVIENRATTAAAGRPYTVGFQRVPGTNRIVATGQVPRGAGSRTVYVAVHDPARWTATVFRETLQARGIGVGDPEVRVISHPPDSPVARARALVHYHSPALPDVIDPVLRNSQNWYSEQLAKTLGREVRGSGSWEAGLAVHGEFLSRTVGIPDDEFVLRDGSGLSDGNRITPAALAELLAYVYRTPGQEVVRRSLPGAGRTGSLRARLADLTGRVYAKTGFISGVNALAGYVVADSGREMAFVVFSNGGEPAARMRGGIDDVVRAIASDAGD